MSDIRGMTGKDLQELLSFFSEEDLSKPIMFTHNSGDHWRTIIATPVNDVVSGNVKYSEYHSAFQEVSGEFFTDAHQPVLVLK